MVCQNKQCLTSSFLCHSYSRDSRQRVMYSSEVDRKIRVWWEGCEFKVQGTEKKEVVCSKNKILDLGK